MLFVVMVIMFVMFVIVINATRLVAQRVVGLAAQGHMTTLWWFAAAAATIMAVQQVRAQEYLLSTRLITQQQGLASTQVKAFTQDHEGFLWIGGDKGLQRFDGYRFVTYRHDASNAQSLSSNDVLSLAEDNRGVLWIGTGNGLNALQTRTGNITRFAHPLKGRVIRALYYDKTGLLWIGTNQSVYCYHPLQDSCHEVALQSFTKTSPSNISPQQPQRTFIQRIYEDNNGTLWVQSSGNELFEYRREQQMFRGHSVHIPEFEIGDYDIIPNHNQFGITLKLNPVLGIASAQYRPVIGTLQLPSGAFTAHKQGSYSFLSAQPSAMLDVRVKAFDLLGYAWVSVESNGQTSASGLYYVAPNASQLPPKPLVRGTATAFYRDRAGTVWAGIENVGVVCCASNGIKSYIPDTSSAPYQSITALHHDNKRLLWLGTNAGLFCYDSLQGSWKRYTLGSGAANNITSMCQDSQGRLLVATGNGVFVRNAARDVFELLALQGFVNSGEVSSIMVEKKYGSLWLYSADGLMVFDKRGERLHRYDARSKPSDLTDEPVYALFNDSRGAVWCGTLNGLNKWQEESSILSAQYSPQAQPISPFLHFREEIGGTSVTALGEDKTGNLLLGFASGGMSIVNVMSRHITRVTSKQGLLDNSITNVLCDQSNRTWLTTGNGAVMMYTPPLHQCAMVLPPNNQQILHGSSFQTSDGSIYLSYGKSCVAFHPDVVSSFMVSPSVVLSSLSTPQSNHTPLGRRFFHGDTIVFQYNESATFELAALSYKFPERNRYHVIVQSLDSDWKFEVQERIVYLSSLPPGKYLFRATAASADNVWSVAPLTFTLLVHPPFWQRWWFIAGSVFAFCVVTLGGFYYRARLIVGRKQAEYDKLAARRETERVRLEQLQLQREKEQAEQEKHLIERKALDFQLKTLHLQLNPHFLRNVLVPLREFIDKDQKEEASAYLSTFAALLDAIFQQSSQTLVSLHDEIAFLRTYLSLEQQCEHYSFDFTILEPPVLPNNITLKTAHIPPMLIQPFLENAIRHGIKPLREQKYGHFHRRGQLSVTFRCTERNLFCTIEDNGIGRDLAWSRQRKNETDNNNNHSTGMIQERLKILQTLHDVPVEHEYTDLYDSNNKPLGTRVFLHIPIFVLNPPIEPPYSLKHKVSASNNTTATEPMASDDTHSIKPFIYS